MAALIVILAYCIIDEDNEDDTLLVERCHYNDLSEMSDRHFKDNFGLIRGEFEQIHEALQLPQPVRTVYKDVEDSRIALLMLLAYLRGRSVKGLESQFGWSAARVSRIRLEVGELLLEKWGQRLDPRQCGETLLCKQNLQRYAQSIYKQCHVDCIWGFIDGTLRPLARPIRYQEAVYNGWKHIHALKYQFVTTPDGLIFFARTMGWRHARLQSLPGIRNPRLARRSFFHRRRRKSISLWRQGLSQRCSSHGTLQELHSDCRPTCV